MSVLSNLNIRNCIVYRISRRSLRFYNGKLTLILRCVLDIAIGFATTYSICTFAVACQYIGVAVGFFVSICFDIVF